MTRITLDLHHIYTNSRAIEDALQGAFDEVIEKRIRELEILSGNNHSQLLNKVERFLQQPATKKYYQRMENDRKSQGKMVLYFKF